MGSKTIDKVAGLGTETTEGFKDEGHKFGSFGSGKGGIVPTLVVGSSGGSNEAALAREGDEAAGGGMSDAHVKEEDLWSEDDTKIRAAAIDPVILAGFNEALSTWAVDPISNDVDAGVMTPGGLRTSFVGENVPGVRGEVCTTKAGWGGERGKGLISAELAGCGMDLVGHGSREEGVSEPCTGIGGGAGKVPSSFSWGGWLQAEVSGTLEGWLG
jgi:hypothetical protein